MTLIFFLVHKAVQKDMINHGRFVFVFINKNNENFLCINMIIFVIVLPECYSTLRHSHTEFQEFQRIQKIGSY